MANLTFHKFLVQHAMFPFPETSITDDTASCTEVSEVEVGLIQDEWKACCAIFDGSLFQKLCDALEAILGERPLVEEEARLLLRSFMPALLTDEIGAPINTWSENPNEAQSKRLLDLGVFGAMEKCLWSYNRYISRVLVEQKVNDAKSAIDFQVLIGESPILVVEAKSPKVMKQLGLLPPKSFPMTWKAGSGNLASKLFTKAALDLGLRRKEWLFLTSHNHWIVCRLVRGGDEKPFLAYSPLITMENSSVPFRAFLGAVLSVVQGEVVEASVFDCSMELDVVVEEETPNAYNGPGRYMGRPCKEPTGPGPVTLQHAQDAVEPALMISSSPPLSPESSQVWIRLHPLPNDIFALPEVVQSGKQRLWLTRLLGYGSTGSVWLCHFDNVKQPFAVKVVEVLRSSDIEARKRFRNEFEVYLTIEEAHQSGKLQDRIAPRCYGAFEGENIDVLILDLHDTILDSWDQLKPPERREVFKLVCDLHSLGIAHYDLEPRNTVRTRDGKLLLIDFTQSRMHDCVARHSRRKTSKCHELKMFRRLLEMCSDSSN